MEWIKTLQPKDLPSDDMKLVAERCGMEIVVRLAERMGSVPIYIRPIEGLIAEKKRAYIIEHFTGDNHKQLALDTEWSVRQVYYVLEERHQAAAIAAKIRQKTLF